MEPGLIQSALDLELAEGSVVGRHPGLVNRRAIACWRILHPDEAPPSPKRAGPEPQCLRPWGNAIEAAICHPWVIALELAASQKVAVEQPSRSKVLWITGGARGGQDHPCSKQRSCASGGQERARSCSALQRPGRQADWARTTG